MSASDPPLPDTPPTVLVVEDEVLIRLAIAQYLRHCGWCVLEARSADEAVKVLESSDVQVEVVFSDVQMPGGMDGLGLARWVRANRPDVRVLLTSGGPAEIVAKAADLCEDASVGRTFFHKPYSEREVVRRIEAMLGRAAQRRRPTT